MNEWDLCDTDDHDMWMNAIKELKETCDSVREFRRHCATLLLQRTFRNVAAVSAQNHPRPHSEVKPSTNQLAREVVEKCNTSVCEAKQLAAGSPEAKADPFKRIRRNYSARRIQCWARRRMYWKKAYRLLGSPLEGRVYPLYQVRKLQALFRTVILKRKDRRAKVLKRVERSLRCALAWASQAQEEESLLREKHRLRQIEETKAYVGREIQHVDDKIQHTNRVAREEISRRNEATRKKFAAMALPSHIIKEVDKESGRIVYFNIDTGRRGSKHPHTQRLSTALKANEEEVMDKVAGVLKRLSEYRSRLVHGLQERLEYLESGSEI